MSIHAAALEAGHCYVQGAVNAFCPKCSEEESERLHRRITVLTCDEDWDDDDDECQGHADGPVMGETFYCDGTCR